MRRANAQVEVAHRRAICGDDVDVDAEAIGDFVRRYPQGGRLLQANTSRLPEVAVVAYGATPSMRRVMTSSAAHRRLEPEWLRMT